jgi:tetratricopeptide (TPR) repeat protein
MQDVIGRVYMSLGLYEPSRTLLAASLDTRRAHVQGADPQVAQSLEHLGQVLQEQGKYGDAETQLRASLASAARAVRTDARAGRGIARPSLLLAQVKGDLPGAEALIKGSAGHPAGDPRRTACLGGGPDEGSGNGAAQAGQAQAAVASLETARRPAEVLGTDHPALADSLNALGMAEQNREQLDAAESYFREALAITTRVLGARHAHTATTQQPGRPAYQRQTSAAAEPIFREALEQKRAALGNDHPSVATSMTNLGVVLLTSASSTPPSRCTGTRCASAPPPMGITTGRSRRRVTTSAG